MCAFIHSFTGETVTRSYNLKLVFLVHSLDCNLDPKYVFSSKNLQTLSHGITLKHQPCGLAYTLVLFYGMKCLDEQWISGKTLEMKSFDLAASRSYLRPGERRF